MHQHCKHPCQGMAIKSPLPTNNLYSNVSQRWSLGLGCNFSFRKDFVSLDFFARKNRDIPPFVQLNWARNIWEGFPLNLENFWLSPSAVKFDIFNVLVAKAKEPVWHHLFALKLRLPDLSWCSGIQAFVSFSQTCWFQPYSCYLAIITRAPKGSRWERKRWELVQWKIFWQKPGWGKGHSNPVHISGEGKKGNKFAWMVILDI